MISIARMTFSLLAFTVVAQAQQGLEGNWRTPGDAVVRIAPCGGDLCAVLEQLEPNSPVQVDAKNPEQAKRSQPLCGLQIGYGFHRLDQDHAQDGFLYDPKSGKTYRGVMSSTGLKLSLRGYVGVKAFGRTEQWTRSSDAVKPCH